MKHFQSLRTFAFLFTASVSTALHGQVTTASVDNLPVIKPDAARVSPPAPDNFTADAAECGDALSSALSVAGSAGMPCWSNLRASERWNATDIPDGGGLHTNGLHVPQAASSQFTYAGGVVGSAHLAGSASPNAIGGGLGATLFLDRERWQLAVEDAGILAVQDSGAGKRPAGLNRGGARLGVQLKPRLTWQSSVANTYGIDLLRLTAPLDLRRVGTGDSSAQLPVAETATFGLHSGTVVSEQEDTRLRFEHTRRSNWEFAVAHALQHYSDTGSTTQVERGRVEFLHAYTTSSALGFFSTAQRQTGLAKCSFVGGGIRALSSLGARASVNISAAANAADSKCGQRALFTGDAAASARVGERTWLSVTASRGLSDGVVENVAVLNSAVVGLRHTFQSLLDVSFSAAAVLGNNVSTQKTVTGTFAQASVHIPLGPYLTAESSLRHFQVTPSVVTRNPTLLTSTLWFHSRSTSTR